MTSESEINLRKLILAEWEAETKAFKAFKNIRKKAPATQLIPIKVRYWYARFQSGDKNIEDTRPTDACRIFDRILFAIDRRRPFSKEMVIDDGRIALFPPGHARTNFLAADLFHGTKRKIKFDGDQAMYFDWTLIESKYFLVCGIDDYHGSHLHLFKLDRDEWKIDLIDSVETQFGHLVVDEFDARHFVLVYRDIITEGHVEEDKIKLKGMKEYQFGESFGHFKFEDEKLFYFHGISIPPNQWEFCELHLDIMKECRNEINIATEDGKSIDFVYIKYAWFEKKLYFTKNYLARNMEPDIRQSDLDRCKIPILAFDSETLKWSDTGISVLAWEINGMFIDKKSGIMTLQAGINRTNVFYRIPLKNPDRLENIAFLHMRNRSILHGSDLFDDLSLQLPQTTDLHNQVPNDPNSP